MNSIKRLSAMHSLPFCTPDGEIVSRVGWGAGTGIYLHLPVDYSPVIPERPTDMQVSAALKAMMLPFRGYQWAGADDAAAAVCAVMMAVMRPTLSLCPAVLVESSTQGSGKTLFASALCSLMTGRREGVLPFSGIDDEELKKQIISGVLNGQRSWVFDNLVGHYKSPTLAAALTSGRLRGRVLGASREVDASIRALFTLTANNSSIDADLMRRLMRVRINSGVSPTLRRFEFCPVAETLRDRVKIAEAACVIWRAYFNAGAPRLANDDAGGFTDWSNLCRQPVLWLANEGLSERLGWALGDPAASMLADPANGDPEVEAHGDLLRALHALTPDRGVFGSRQLLEWFRAGEYDNGGALGLVREAVADCLNLRAGQEPGARSLGRMLMFRRDRVVGGLQLLARDDRAANAKLWRVVTVA